MTDDARYWVLDAANETNRLDEIQRFLGIPIVALVDDERGIIAYGIPEIINACAEALNATPLDWQS